MTNDIRPMPESITEVAKRNIVIYTGLVFFTALAGSLPIIWLVAEPYMDSSVCANEANRLQNELDASQDQVQRLNGELAVLKKRARSDATPKLAEAASVQQLQRSEVTKRVNAELNAERTRRVRAESQADQAQRRCSELESKLTELWEQVTVSNNKVKALANENGELRQRLNHVDSLARERVSRIDEITDELNLYREYFDVVMPYCDRDFQQKAMRQYLDSWLVRLLRR